MIALPTVEKLKNVKNGSLVSFPVDNDTSALGIRVERSKDAAPVIVCFEKAGNLIQAWLLPDVSGAASRVNPQTFVAVHGDDWQIHVRPNDWSAQFGFITFASQCNGLLLIGENDVMGCAVGAPGLCCYLNFKTWKISDHNSESYMTARLWNISVPGMDGKRQLLLP